MISHLPFCRQYTDHSLKGLKEKNVEVFFVQAVEGLFDYIHISAVQNEAEGYIKKLATAALENELRRIRPILR